MQQKVDLEVILALLLFCDLTFQSEDGDKRILPSLRTRYSSWMDGRGNFWIAGGSQRGSPFDDIWYYNGTEWKKLYDLDAEHHRSHPNISVGTVLCASGSNLALSVPKKEVNETEIWVFDGQAWTTYLCLSEDESSVCPHTKAVFTVCDSTNSRILLIDVFPRDSVKRRLWSFDAKKNVWMQEKNNIVGVEPQFEKCAMRWNSVDGVALLCDRKLHWMDLNELRWFELIDVPFNEESVFLFSKVESFLVILLVVDFNIQLAVANLKNGVFEIMKSNVNVTKSFAVNIEGRRFFVPRNNSDMFKLRDEVVLDAVARDHRLEVHCQFLFGEVKNETYSKEFLTEKTRSPLLVFSTLTVVLILVILLSYRLCTSDCRKNSLACRIPATPVRYTAIKDESFMQ